jgi:hypothetical protein
MIKLSDEDPFSPYPFKDKETNVLLRWHNLEIVDWGFESSLSHLRIMLSIATPK